MYSGNRRNSRITNNNGGNCHMDNFQLTNGYVYVTLYKTLKHHSKLP